MFGFITSKAAARGVLKQMTGAAGSKNDPEVLTTSKNQLIRMSKIVKVVAYVVIFFIGIPFIFIYLSGLVLIPLGWWFIGKYLSKQNQYLEEAHSELLVEMSAKA